MCVFCSAKMPRKERRIKLKKKELLEADTNKYYLTFKLKTFLFCFFFKTASWHLLLYQYRSIRINTHISKECVTIHCCYDILCTALFKALFHVPLLYFEHLPLQRSLHGPAAETSPNHVTTERFGLSLSQLFLDGTDVNISQIKINK